MQNTSPMSPNEYYSYDTRGPLRAKCSRLFTAVDAFKLTLCRCDREALRSDRVPPTLAEEARLAFAGIETIANEELGDGSPLDPTEKAAAGERLQAELLPYLLLAENGARWYSKPRGYAGDYLSIARVYENQARGHGRLGALVDRCFLDLAAARAVRNRCALLTGEILATIDARSDRPAHVASLACGPAKELFDVYETLSDPSTLEATLVDFDLQALAYVAECANQRKLGKRMELINRNLIHVATGRQRMELAFGDQDLVYSIGLIDYFPDPLVIHLIDFIHSVLRPGGRLILGNFHPHSVSKAVMDHVLDWKLFHRTEVDMHRLFAASAFQRPCTRILHEAQRVNLFAECVKA